MPLTHNIALLVDGQPVEIGELANMGITMGWSMEAGDDFRSKQASMALDIALPATPGNDRIFNSYHNPAAEDTTGTDHYTNPRRCEILVGGITILRGRSLLQSATHTRMPGGYNINCYGQNGDWSIDMKDLTLWDCLNPNSHTFDVATIETSWLPAGSGGYDSDEDHDYVYAPVRYRSPFGEEDDRVNIFHLRPSISIYWLLVRAFRTYGYRIESQFISSAFFRKLVLPWVWGDFFDIYSQLVDVIGFKAAGDLPTEPPTTVRGTGIQLWTGTTSGTTAGSAGGSSWRDNAVSGGLNASGVIQPTGGVYIFSNSGTNHWRIINTNPPNGYDNLGLYSFFESTAVPPPGSLLYYPQIPAAMLGYIGTNFTVKFRLSLLLYLRCFLGNQCMVALEVTHVPVATGIPIVTTTSILPSGGTVVGATHYPTASGYPTTPTIYEFSVPNVNDNDFIYFRLRALQDGPNPIVCFVAQSGYLDQNAGLGTPSWVPMYSTLEMVGLEVGLGGSVNLKLYDKFRSYGILDMLRGLVDKFDLSIGTNSIDKVVTIEPTHGYTLPDGTAMAGYTTANRTDWTAKQDVSKANTMELYSDTERQYDFAHKNDGADGGLNIWAARYKGIYLNNSILNPVNNTNGYNGMVTGVPGASRYMFPERFRKGAKAQINRFFAPSMHYQHTSWKNLGGFLNPAPQLMAIFPENISDSSAGAVKQTFEPRMAYYRGQDDPDKYGRWRWIGNPAAPYSEATSVGFLLPLMFSVYYGWLGQNEPVLSYSDQLINGVVVPGLMRRYFMKRLATMRHGRLYKAYMHLPLSDITDWEHRESIVINNNVYRLVGIEGYNPLNDNSCQCALWLQHEPEQRDVDSSYPSATSLAGGTLTQFDLKYAPLLLYPTDIPQV